MLLKRPDYVEIYWEERGEGPLVLFAMQFFGYPETFEDLIGDLSADHRTVVYHLRGTGLSTHRGPYRLETDADDLGALLEEAGGDAVVIGMADGSNRAVKVAAAQPELVRAVVSPGGNPAGRRAAQGTEALAASDSVLEALQSMLDTDYRTALRTMLDTANPQLDDDGLRERLDRTVEHCPYEAAAPRLRDWIADDSTEQALLLGDRLWVLEHGKNPWFPIEVARRTRELLPQAQVMEVADGPLSRPDLTSAVVREITSPARVAPTAGSSEGS